MPVSRLGSVPPRPKIAGDGWEFLMSGDGTQALPDLVLVLVLLQAAVITVALWSAGARPSEEVQPALPEEWQELQAIEGFFDSEPRDIPGPISSPRPRAATSKEPRHERPRPRDR